MLTPKISVIVPVYKVERYIEQCIESVLSQTYENLELLLVDDGSPDSSGVICDEHAAKDNRVHVFHKENGGVSSARNVGLKNMTGDWVCFLDSDDWWAPTFLQNFINVISTRRCDIVLQGYIEENEIKGTRRTVALPESTFCSAGELIVFLENAKGVHNGFLWHRIFKANVFRDNGITFPQGISFAEDGDVFFRYMKHATTSVIISKCGYHYRKVEGSLTSKGKLVPEETLAYLIEAYASSIYGIIEAEGTAKHVANALKLYIWRLFIAWQIERCTTDYASYLQKQRNLHTRIVRYHLNETSSMPLEIKLLAKAVINQPSKWNYKLIKATIKYREIKQRIKNKL